MRAQTVRCELKKCVVRPESRTRDRIVTAMAWLDSTLSKRSLGSRAMTYTFVTATEGLSQPYKGSSP